MPLGLEAGKGRNRKIYASVYIHMYKNKNKYTFIIYICTQISSTCAPIRKHVMFILSCIGCLCQLGHSPAPTAAPPAAPPAAPAALWASFAMPCGVGMSPVWQLTCRMVALEELNKTFRPQRYTMGTIFYFLCVPGLGKLQVHAL